ncbi:MAG: O-antigen ligase family protein [Defluviitaleaceae bacterium]|nr:O-antigen ligase family protein [Defluviitaleaceae bacterium]
MTNLTLFSIWIWRKIELIMEGSLFFRFVNGMMDFFARVFSGSVVSRVVTSESDEIFLRGSLIFRMVNGFFLALKRFGRNVFRNAYEGSGIVRFVRGIPRGLFTMSLRSVGLGMAAGVAAYVAASGGLARIDAVIILLSAVAVLCLLTGKSVYAALKGSVFVALALDALSLSLPAYTERHFHTRNRLWLVFAGIFLGIAASAFDQGGSLVLLGAAGIAGATVVAAYPFVGAAGVLFLAPYLPTMLTAMLIIGVSACFILRLLAADGKHSFRLDLLGVWIVIYMAVGAFAAVNSFTPLPSIEIAVLTGLYMWFAILLMSVVSTKGKLHAALVIFAVSALGTGLYGLWQRFSGMVDTTHLDEELFEGMTLRLFSTFDNPNVYGTYLLLAIPLCLVGALLAHKLWLRFAYLGTALLLMANLGFTYSRGCYVAIAVTAFVFVLLMEKRLIALFAGGIFLVPILLPPTMLDRLLSITNLADSSTAYRIAIWQASLRGIREFWYAGVGQGTHAFNAVYQLNAFNTVTAQHSHNLFLQIFIETGIVGLGVFFALIITFYKLLYPFYKRADQVRLKAAAALMMAMMAGFLTQGVFDFNFYNYKVYLAFFASLALASIFVRVYGDRAEVVEFA